MDSVVTEYSSVVIRLTLAPQASAGVRFAISPAEETLQLVRLLSRTRRLREPAMNNAQERLAQTHVDALVDTVSGDRFFPEFLSPAPRSIDDKDAFVRQTALCRQTPVDQVQRELDLALDGRDRHLDLREEPDRVRDRLIDQLITCHDFVLGPLWTRVADILRTDINVRAQRFAAEGLNSVLASLHPTMAMHASTLVTQSPHNIDIAVPDDGPVLVPTVFGDRSIGLMLEPPGPIRIVYPARGSALLHEQHQPEVQPLATLLGATRYEILRSTSEPASTIDLAARLALAPSTVSEHLTKMAAAGWVTRRRVRRRVHYELSRLGQQIVERSEP